MWPILTIVAGIVAAVAVLWLVVLVCFAILRPDGATLRDSARIVPDTIRLIHRLERGCDQVLDECVNLDPDTVSSRQSADGRSVWIETVAPSFPASGSSPKKNTSSPGALTFTKHRLRRSATVDVTSLDVPRAAAAAAVAGQEPLVLVVGPAGTGKTRTLQRDARVEADTVAKLLYEWSQPERPPGDRYRLAAGATVLCHWWPATTDPNVAGWPNRTCSNAASAASLPC